ncbi:glucan endo-1-3-beta-glucosidase btgC [Penicillium cosmopolitanum]|uniref:glucan endo-1,3-beta-D-glucosidase n=1 Tax=Penicillium cosmopolitanum TaxID=1131564 RepID=A0A9X0BAB7_9EURO|nr:glucan endo-1-3-beta-glucosidase btgC [Penicillium cosmopolitanum]KAJ5397562.1 glucan endo-1-3-beta-glucosidase btgC [Penicillium cosmopolitanum]
MNADIPAPSHRYAPDRNDSTVTPGVDNLGPASVGGGISGIALGVANSHDRLSGIDAVRAMDQDHHDNFTGPVERGYHTTGSDNPYVPQGYTSAESLHAERSYGSNMALGAAAAPPGAQTPGQSSIHLSETSANRRSMVDQYPGSYGAGGIVSDGPYQRQSQYSTNMPDINPNDIADDDDDYGPRSRNRAAPAAGAAAGAAGGTAAGGMFGFFGANKGAAASTAYDPVPGGGGGGLEAGHGGGFGGGGSSGAAAEKAAAAEASQAARKKRGWIAGLVLGLIVVCAIVGGAVGGTLGTKHSDGSSSSDSSNESASSDSSKNGDLNKDSSEIKALLDNDNLHKVFPGMDYTPWGVQYPLCLKYPPSQNNVTRDMAVLSQLTNNVRLYGTDCNQTEMVLHAIDRLELTDMKVWLGVWIDTNKTTTNRQLDQLYKILDDTKDTSIFNGVIVGNEALYRAGSDKQSAQTNLLGYIKDVRSELKKRSIDFDVATSDLGDNWNSQLVSAVDAVMSNVHPFFAGVNIDIAASWTWDFWQSHDVSLTKGTTKKQIISEVGWPSGGGKDCGESPSCDSDTPGSVASLANLNQFMEDWVCQALENGTDYFWFEAFDEPWKIQYNTKDENWEDKWGLMDAGRKIKDGLKIPDCGGKRAT